MSRRFNAYEAAFLAVISLAAGLWIGHKTTKDSLDGWYADNPVEVTLKTRTVYVIAYRSIKDAMVSLPSYDSKRASGDGTIYITRPDPKDIADVVCVDPSLGAERAR